MIREFEDRDSKNRIVAEEKKILRNSRRTIEAESIPLERKNLRNEEEKRWKARGGRNSLVQLVITDYGLKLRPWRIEIRRIWSEKGRSLMFKSRNEETFLRVTSACRSRWQRSIQILFRASSSSFFSVGPAHPVTNMRFLRDSFFFFGEEKVGRWRIEIEMLSRLMGD